MERVHQRFLTHFVEQDVVGHMEADLDGAPLDLGRLRVAIAFADLAGYTRMTEEFGDEYAVDIVDGFITEVEHTLPDDARIIKTIGPVVTAAGPHLEFELIGEVRLKGFTGATELFVARAPRE
jgi:adenylate cyclase